MKSNIQIGEYILNYRKQHRLTQGEFGELLGVSTQAVSKWERKICYPDIFLLPAISELIGISISLKDFISQPISTNLVANECLSV